VLVVVSIVVILTVLVGMDQEWHRALVYRTSALAQKRERLPTLIVDMRYADYSILLDQREEALRAGVYSAADQDFAPAVARAEGEQIPVEIRLMEGPAHRLGDDEKWSYEVRTQEDQALLGVRHFHLMDPAANHWLDQWAFVQALRREGILVGRYQFVRLVWNGDDRGVYALQEAAGEELLKAQGRWGTVILSFDADRVWNSIAHTSQAGYDDPVSHLCASDLRTLEIDTLDDLALSANPKHAAQRERAVERMRSLQAGELPASEVLDVDRYGRYLALVDLWGALDGLSLTQLKFYYDPVADRLEPISFGANALGSEARLSLATTYGDRHLQEAYVREATRISHPEYVDRLRADIGAEWQQVARALGRDASKIAPPWEALRQRQQQIRRSLVPVQPIFAHQVMPSSASPSAITPDTLQVEVANVLNLPVEIIGFEIDGATFLNVDPSWMDASAGDSAIERADGVILRALNPTCDLALHYVRFDIPLTEIHRLDREVDLDQEPDLYVLTRLLGRSEPQRTLARHDR
jgi:hypothetical protein